MTKPLPLEQLAQALTSYLPPAVARAVWASPTLLAEPARDSFSAAVLFADISGFTALTEKLALQGPYGAEELTLLLNRYFSRMIDLLAAEGGEVVQFSGDALMAVFPVRTGSGLQPSNAGPDASRPEILDLSTSVQHARRAARQMKAAMSEFASFSTSLGQIALGMKIGLGVGEVTEFSAGGVRGRWHYIIAGDPLRQVGEAEHRAQRGQIVLSPEAQALAGTNNVQSAKQPLPVGLDRPFQWNKATDETITALQSRLPYVITYRLTAGQADWLAEIRRLSILFLGLGGLDYTAAGGLGQVQRWMTACQEIIYRYEGSLNKLLVDDKGTIGLVLFGAPPRSHEDDALRAVRCALDLQQAAKAQQLRLAVGLTTGQIFAGPVGSDIRREYTVMGDGVNLAARLMQLAGAGGIRGDYSTYQATRERIDWQPLPPQTVKGKTAAVRLYHPLALQTRRRVADEKKQLVGRAEEISRIKRAFDQSRAGQFRILCLEGEAGIGKSSLVSILTQDVSEAGLVGLFGHGDALEQQTPYNAWREIFKSYFNLEASHDRAGQRRKVLARLDEIAPNLVQRGPLLNDLLALGLPETSLTASFEPKLRQASLSALLADLLALWAEEQPLVLVLEDAQWLDSLSWQLAAQVARSLQALPVLLVLVLRPLENLSSEHPSQQLTELLQWDRLDLAPLQTTEAVTLAAARLGVPELPAEIANLIVQRAGGNPFMVEEVALSLQDSGAIHIVNGHCLPTSDFSKLKVPETLHGLVLSRIDRLPPAEQLTLKVASAIGRTFGYSTLRDIYTPSAGLDETQLQDSIDCLTGYDMLLPLESPTMLRSHTFRQAIMQEVIYGTLLQAQRQELHHQTARWYEAYIAASIGSNGSDGSVDSDGSDDSNDSNDSNEEYPDLYPLLAYHWRQARVPSRELHYAILAAKYLAANYANNEALRFLDRAMGLTDDPATQYDLLQLRLAVHDRLGNRQAQQNDLTQLQALTDQGDNLKQRIDITNAWADYYRHISNYPAAIDVLQRTLGIARQIGDLAREARSLTIWGRVLENQGDYQPARGYLAQALAHYRQLNDQPGQANNLSALSNIHRYLGNMLAAQANALEALNIWRAIGDKAREATSLTNLGILSQELGDLEAAKSYWQQGLHISRTIGDRSTEALSLSTLGHGYWMQGDYAVAQCYLQQALQRYQMMGDRLREANCLDALGMVWRDLGDDSQAAHSFQQALSIQEEIGHHSLAAYTYLNLGLALLHQDRKATQACYQKALYSARETNTRDAEAYALSYQAALDEHRGNWEAAYHNYQAALTIRHELQAAAAAIEDTAGLARAALNRGNLPEACRQAEKCLTYIETKGVAGMEFPLIVYLTCYDILQAAGEGTRARFVLEDAHALLVERIEAVGDPAWRESMRQNVPINRRVLAEWEAINSVGTDISCKKQ